MANNPSYGRYESERTIFEDLVGAQFGTLPTYQQPPKEPKPATFSSYAAPVELNPFLNIEMRVVPPRDATQEALNEYGRRGYLSRSLIADSRIREQEVLQQTVESKVNSIVNDEYERRRAVRRGVFEATGMTPAEIDERFAADVLAQRENAVTRATTDGQVRDALARYFTLRGGIVPAYLNPPPVVAPAVNNEAGVQVGGGAAVGLPQLDADNVDEDAFAGADPFAAIDPFADLGGAPAGEELPLLGGGGRGLPPLPAAAEPPAAGVGLTPTEWDSVIAIRDSAGGGAGVTKDVLARFLVMVGAVGISGRELTLATWKKQSQAELSSAVFRWLRLHPFVEHPDDLTRGGGAAEPPATAGALAKGGVPLPAGGSNAAGGGPLGLDGGAAPLPPRGGADEGAVAGDGAVDTAGDPLADPRVRRKLRLAAAEPPATAGAGGQSESEIDRLFSQWRRQFEGAE